MGQFTCAECGFVGISKSSLKQHVEYVHDNLKRYKCVDCQLEFYHESALKEHVKSVHDKVKDFVCKICNQKFSRVSHLNQHMKEVHDKSKPYSCPQCNYTCSTAAKLKRHSKTCTAGSNLSSGEFKLQGILKKIGVEFETGTYKVQNPKTGCMLRWDIIILTKIGPLFIKYDGKQHFEQVSKFPDQIGRYTISRPNEKRLLCRKNIHF